VTVSGTILISVVTTLIVGALLFSGLAVGSASTWLTLIPVLLLGLLVAPILLRWVARRESGSSVAARREKVLRQVAG
jgi:hypothetical protein